MLLSNLLESAKWLIPSPEICVDQTFIVHMEDPGKPNMEFNMHKFGPHLYNPTNKALVLIKPSPKTSTVLTRDKLTVKSKQNICIPNLGIYQLNISGGFSRARKF